MIAALTLVSLVRAGTEQAVADSGSSSAQAKAVAKTVAKAMAYPVLTSEQKSAQAAAAAAQAAPVLDRTELAGDRTLKSRTYLDPVKGLHVTQLSTQPINFKDAAGAWQPIDNTLTADGAGGWKNGASSYAVSLPADLSKPVKVSDALDAKSWVSIQLAPAKTPVDALPPVPGVDQVPVPVVAAVAGKVADKNVPNELTYAKPLTGVDVSYAATGTGVKETTTLASLAAVDTLPAGSLAYTVLAPSALSVTPAKDGGLVAVNSKGEAVFAIPAAFMDDAQGAHSNNVVTALTADKALTTDTQNAWTLTLTPDHAWLAAKDRAWPVAVDPSVVINPPSAMKGCTVRSDTPTVNDCAGSEIITSMNGANERRALLDFDTLLDVVPADAQLAAAYVNLWMPSATGSPSSSVDIFGSKNPWTTAATWNSPDGTGTWPSGGNPTSTVYGRYTFIANGSYQSAQVTRLVQDWALGVPRDWGMVLKKTTADTTALSRFGSPSSANPPNMYIEWDPRTGLRKSNTAIVNEQLSDHTGVAINPASGNAQVTTKEFTIAGMGLDLKVAHTSNSLDAGGLSELGYNWTSTLHGIALRPYDNSGYATSTVDNAESMFYTDGAGAQWTYLRTKDVSATWIRPKGLDMDLSTSGTSPVIYTLTDRKSQTKIKFRSLGTTTNALLGVDTITDRNGNKITYTYDASARSSIDGRLLLRSVTDTRGRVLAVTNTSGTYDSSIADSSSPARSVVYTIGGTSSQLDQVTDAAGGLVKYGYDSAHRVNKVTTPSGQVTEMTYDSAGKILTLKRDDPVTPGNSPLWQFSYTAFTRDSNGVPSRTTTVTDPNNHVTTYVSGGRGLVTKTTDANNKETKKTYSPNDDVATDTGRTGGASAPQTTTYTYDPGTSGDAYQLTKAQIPTGAATSLDYTGQTGGVLYLPGKSTDEQGGTSTYGYDANGNKNKTTRPDGKAEYTLYEGDPDPAYGSAIIHCGPSGAATKAGAVCEKRDAQYTAGTSRAATPGHRTAYEYDAQGQLVTLHPPGSPGGAGSLADQTFTYDSQSRTKTVTDGNSAVTTYGYDALDRVVKITHNDGSYEVNAYGGAAGDGWQTSLKEYTAGSVLTRTTTYTRDWQGRLTTTTSPEGTLGMGYDKADNLTSYTDNSGTTNYGYDPADHLTSLAMPTGSCSGLTYASPGTNTGSGCITFLNDDDGRRIGIKYPGANLTQTATRDDSGRVTQTLAKIGSAEKLKATYNYTGGTPSADRALVMSSTDTVNAGTTRNTAYTYDTLNQLTFVNTTTGGTTTEQFCYQDAGNRTYYYRNGAAAVTCGSGTPAATNTYNSANQLNGATGVTPAGTALAGGPFSYDGNGAETAAVSGIGRTSTNGDRGQVTSFTPAGGSAISQAYSSMGNGQRVTAGTTTFMPSPLGPAPAWSKTGTTTTWTIRDPDGTLLGIRIGTTSNPASGTTYHPFTDRLGNVRAMTTAAGTIQNVTYLYSAYGYTTATSGSLVQPYKWGQGYTDEATGLIKLGIRYYDPTHGRFTQQDPTGKDKYAYSYGKNCANNYNDPSGALTGCDYAAFLLGLDLSVAVGYGALLLELSAAATIIGGGFLLAVAALGITAACEAAG